jgi:hypothetical protein
MTVRRYFGACEEANFNPDTPPEAKFHVEIASALWTYLTTLI